MDVSFEQYINYGTRFLLDYLSDLSIDEEEKRRIVYSYTEFLENQAGEWSELPDYELMAYSISLNHIDNKITEVLSNSDSSYVVCEKAIKLCNREKALKRIFVERGWKFPKLKNNDMDKCISALSERQNSQVILSRVIDTDHKIDELSRTAQSELSVKTCDTVLELVEDLSRDIAVCKQRKISLPSINNLDTKRVVNRITEIKKNAELKEENHKRIYDIDLQIHNNVSQNVLLPNHWAEILSLCKQQRSLFSECQKNGWPFPQVRYADLSVLENKYLHYQEMTRLDNVIYSSQSNLNGDNQYKSFVSDCKTQQNNIELCKMNGWEIPNLVVPNPMDALKAAKKEKEKRDSSKKAKKTLFKIGFVATLILALIICGVIAYRSSRAKIPFDSQSVSGMEFEDVEKILKKAGFENVDSVEDYSGWLESGEVTRVLIDEKEFYDKGTYLKPNVHIVIYYSSSDRVCVTDALEDWEDLNPDDIEQNLRNLGLNGVNVELYDTPDREKEGLVQGIQLNGQNYKDEECYLPLGSPIIIYVYSWKIWIGHSNNDFIGQNYELVVSSLDDSGYTNVVTQIINDGWAEGGSVLSVSVDGKTDYNSDSRFFDDTPIVVSYSSNNRRAATSIISNWVNKDRETIKNELQHAGFTSVSFEEIITWDKSQNYKLASISINGETYSSGDCYIQTNAPIVISYYTLRIKLEHDLDYYTANTEGNYINVVKELKALGFTNIQLFRNNSLINGVVTKEGSIESITINGISQLTGNEGFSFDDPIIIVVNTFKDKGCEDITEVR